RRRRKTSAKKLPSPQAGSRKRESIRSHSLATRSSMSFTRPGGVKTSPWSMIRCLEFTGELSEEVFGKAAEDVPVTFRHPSCVRLSCRKRLSPCRLHLNACFRERPRRGQARDTTGLPKRLPRGRKTTAGGGFDFQVK